MLTWSRGDSYDGKRLWIEQLHVHKIGTNVEQVERHVGTHFWNSPNYRLQFGTIDIVVEAPCESWIGDCASVQFYGYNVRVLQLYLVHVVLWIVYLHQMFPWRDICMDIWHCVGASHVPNASCVRLANQVVLGVFNFLTQCLHRPRSGVSPIIFVNGKKSNLIWRNLNLLVVVGGVYDIFEIAFPEVSSGDEI